MKQLFLTAILAVTIGGIAMAQSNKTLVAYFSCTGNTEKVAKALADVVTGDIYRIEPEKPYTNEDLNWHDSSSRSSIEMNDRSSRPAIAGKVDGMAKYDTIFIGYPIWWGQAPRIISTFLERDDFSGKTLIAFATSGSSGMGNSEDLLKASCSKEAKWLPGRRFASGTSAASLKQWVNGLGF
ncbi:MAG: NAD(P)H-dependent oxidoreductase [Spirochaetaceae bacterium]|nr:NAD(P)H-dependent oxidoreductase [Spirochaetaceae bacterium]